MRQVEFLDRTLRLMRDDPVGDLPDGVLIEALTSTRVVLVADGPTLRSHSARVAFAATAQLAARSGARVYLLAPDVELDTPMAPLRSTRLIEGLMELGADLVPGCAIEAGSPTGAVDVAVIFGGTSWEGDARLTFRLTASRWSGRISADRSFPSWTPASWPFGGLAAAGLAAAEIFKCSMRKLARLARNPALHAEQFAPVQQAHFRLALESVGDVCELGEFDVVSAGAIAQGALFSVFHIPGVRGAFRLIEPERADASNVNRYPLLRRSRIGALKANDVADLAPVGLRATPIVDRFDYEHAAGLAPLTPRVLVGVDDIPSRWSVQACWPAWLGVGATSHYCAMVSHHAAGLPCVGCLHPRDEHTPGPIPTAAFVSFWAGLMLAARFVRSVAGSELPAAEQQVFLPALRVDAGAWKSPVSLRADCPLRCERRGRRAA